MPYGYHVESESTMLAALFLIGVATYLRIDVVQEN